MKERGISPWVGPSDKATPAERAIVERARTEPIAYNPSMSTGGAIIASASGTALPSQVQVVEHQDHFKYNSSQVVQVVVFQHLITRK